MPSIYLQSGEIVGFVVSHPHNEDEISAASLAASNAAGYVDGKEDPATRYVVNGQAVDRPVMQVSYANGVLSGLPDGACLVSINDTDYDVTGPSVALDLAGALEYRITVICWPYQDWTTTIPGA